MYDELTEVDIKKMKEEIDYRIKVLRPQYSADVIMARSYGDLSENAEYREARRKKGQNEGRITYLRNMMKTATIVEASKDAETVGLFDKVKILFEDVNEEQTIIISTAMRIEAAKGYISKKSPLGEAIFGRKVGDRVKVTVDKNTEYYVVIKGIARGEDDESMPINKY